MRRPNLSLLEAEKSVDKGLNFKLIRQKLEPPVFSGNAMKYGLNHESTARSAYVSHQQAAAGIRCDPVGFVVDSHDP